LSSILLKKATSPPIQAQRMTLRDGADLDSLAIYPLHQDELD
jgi:hypothetical protein